MKTQYMSIFAAMALFILAGWGCSGNSPKPKRFYILDSHWGESFESAKRNQILNPSAGESTEPVTGLDGEAAEENAKKYRNRFKDQESGATTYNLDLGTISGIGGE